MNKLLALSVLTIALMSGTASFAQVSVGGATAGSGGVSVDGAIGSGGASVDTNAGGSASGGAALNGMGAEADAFFTSSTRAELRSEAEIRAAFNNLSEERKASLRKACEGDGSANRFCNAIR